MIRNLIYKDLRNHAFLYVSIYLVALLCLLLFSIMQSSYVVLISFSIIGNMLNFSIYFLPLVIIIREVKDKHILFILSLPITRKDYAIAKILNTFLVFLPFSILCCLSIYISMYNSGIEIFMENTRFVLYYLISCNMILGFHILASILKPSYTVLTVLFILMVIFGLGGVISLAQIIPALRNYLVNMHLGDASFFAFLLVHLLILFATIIFSVWFFNLKKEV